MSPMSNPAPKSNVASSAPKKSFAGAGSGLVAQFLQPLSLFVERRRASGTKERRQMKKGAPGSAPAPKQALPAAIKGFFTKEHKGFSLPLKYVRLSIRNQSLFAKRLSFLVNANVALLDSLHIVRDQTSSKSMVRVIDHVIRDIAQGQYLHASLGKLPNTFSGFFVNMIKVGELSGILSANLNYLADELRKREVLRKKIIGALVYPLFITVATLGVTGLLTAYIFPKIMPIFASLKVSLPLTTVILIAVSAYLREWGFLTLIGIAVLVVVFLIIRSMFPKFRLFVEGITLRIPIAGKLVQTYNLANFCRTLGVLLKSGATVTQALDITGDTLDNTLYRKSCHAISARVKKGEQISLSLMENKKLYPSLIGHMVGIGEKTGKLSDTLIYLSGLYEEELDDQAKNLSSSIEPILMVVMGLVVGFVAVSVITPIYSITQSLSR